MIECRECGKEYKNIGSFRGHLSKKHNITVKEYNIKHDTGEKRYCIHCNCDISYMNHRVKYCDSEECKKKTIQKNNHKQWRKKTQYEYEDKEEWSDYVVCKICGFKSSNIQRHITRLHDISLEDYKEIYNCDDCSIYSIKYRENISNKNKGRNNGAYGHNGRYSPYSRNFVKYDGLSDEEKDERISELSNKQSNSLKNNQNSNNQLGYWKKRGYTEEEAREKVRERQTTFSMEKCIDKYGKEEGVKLFKERQEKWQNTINSKSPEEIERINRAKFLYNKGFSDMSQELFWILYNEIYNDFNNIYFAQLDKNKQLDESGKNNEYFKILPNRNIFLDFFIKDTNKIIEFDGDYWHGKARGNQQRDKERDKALIDAGYEILHVRERDWKSNKEDVIQQCLEFIYG